MNFLRRLFSGSGGRVKAQVPLDELQQARPGIERFAWLEDVAGSAKLTLREPASLATIDAFEKTSGIRLPDDHVFFLTRIGNGGTAPCRLQCLDDWDAAYWSAAVLDRDLSTPCLITPELESAGEKWLEALGVENAEEKWEHDEWDPMRGTITVAEYGCGLFYRMIVNGPHRGRIFLWGDRVLNPPCFEPQPDFAGWIGFHLAQAAENRPVHFLNGRLPSPSKSPA